MTDKKLNLVKLGNCRNLKDSFFGSDARKFDTFKEALDSEPFELWTGSYKDCESLQDKPDFIAKNCLSGLMSMLTNSGIGKHAFICLRLTKLTPSNYALDMYAIFGASNKKPELDIESQETESFNLVTEMCPDVFDQFTMTNYENVAKDLIINMFQKLVTQVASDEPVQYYEEEDTDNPFFFCEEEEETKEECISNESKDDQIDNNIESQEIKEVIEYPYYMAEDYLRS